MSLRQPANSVIVGASRGLGLALAQEFLKREWLIVGTVRGEKKTKLHDLANEFQEKLAIESVDIQMSIKYPR